MSVEIRVQHTHTHKHNYTHTPTLYCCQRADWAGAGGVGFHLARLRILLFVWEKQ